MLAPAWHGVPVATGQPQRKQSAAVLACSSFLSNKVQREAMLDIKKPKLPLPPHGFHTYEAEYERKTTVTSSIIYLVADVWLHSNCSSISLLPNKPDSVAWTPVGLTRKNASFIFCLTSVVFINVNLGTRVRDEREENPGVAVVWYWFALIWWDEVQAFLWHQHHNLMVWIWRMCPFLLITMLELRRKG